MIQNAPTTQPNLYLIGFMGTGKSSVGKFASDKLGLKFLDSDQEIERQNGCTISQIFESQGEEKFRELEKKFILTGHPQLRLLGILWRWTPSTRRYDRAHQEQRNCLCSMGKTRHNF